MPTDNVSIVIDKFENFIKIVKIEIEIQKNVRPTNIVFWLFKSFILSSNKNMRVKRVKIPEIINHKIIEISDVLPPTNVSSNASFTKYKIIPLYNV